MVRTMRDSTSLSDIPRAQLDIIAPYVNGLFASSLAQVRARFPTQPIAWIDVNGTHLGADILDVETGDATPDGAVRWVIAKRLLQLAATHPLYPPIIYCNRSTLTPVFNAMNAAHLHVGHDFRLWIATLDGHTKTVPDMTGVTAVQWRPAQATSGLGHYDESAVYDDTWLAPVPVPAGPARPGTPVVRTADGHTALRAALHAHGTPEVATGLELMLANGGGRFGKRQRVYVDAGNWNADMPAGMLYVTAT
jgi:hypothetical protein